MWMTGGNAGSVGYGILISGVVFWIGKGFVYDLRRMTTTFFLVLYQGSQLSVFAHTFISIHSQ